MKTTKQQSGFSQKLLVLALLGAFGSAHADEADDDMIVRLTEPESSVSAGLSVATGGDGDRTIFSQFNGLRRNDANLLLDFSVVKLDRETGLWTRFEGRNLALDNRELSFSQNKQGDWKYSAEYNEITRHEFRTINTGLLGAGTTTPVVNTLAAPGTGADLNLELKRKVITLGGEKWLAPNLLLVTSFRNEDKSGARLSGTGIMCSSLVLASRFACGDTGALLMLPEPINSTTRQLEAKLNFSGENFLLTGGYYGSFYDNANGSLNPSGGPMPDGSFLVPGGATLGGYLSQPLALTPDNQAHQLSVSGHYAFTPTTRANFKYAYTHATQDEDFLAAGLTGSPGPANLGGVMDTTLAQFGLMMRPVSKLSVFANLRYEDKQDKTPVVQYRMDNTGATYSNSLNSAKKINGKLEAAYQLPYKYRATVGVDYAEVQRGLPNVVPDLGLVFSGMREKTQELGYRAELRRALSEEINAAIGYEESRRDGGGWTLYPGANNIAGSLGSAYPMTMTDRKRDKVKLTAGWTPTDVLSLQFLIENGKDQYFAPTSLASPLEKGLRDSAMRAYGMDASLILTGGWRLTGYMNRVHQTQHVEQSVTFPANGYRAELENVNTTLGVGANGKFSERLDVGADLLYLSDSNRYSLSTTGGLPDVTYRMTRLKLFGKYALEKNTDVRLDLVHQSAKLDEWSWGSNGIPFVYSDNSTVVLQQNQSATFIGASYIYKFR